MYSEFIVSQTFVMTRHEKKSCARPGVGSVNADIMVHGLGNYNCQRSGRNLKRFKRYIFAFVVFIVYSAEKLIGVLRRIKPATQVQAKPDTVPERKPALEPETDMKKVIEKYEGIRIKAYDAQPKNPKVHDTTIGIGFNLNRDGAKETFEKIVPGVDFNNVKSGQQTITEDQARALFNHDVDNIYEPRARNKVGKDVYDKLPSNVKTAVVNAVYRGDLGPKTTDLIKQGKWNEVGKEYLDHNQYKNAEELGISGVKTRMDWNKKQFDTMIKP
ncbi:uncharacterized protein LOC128549334 [Mercenaria mercenaria]|uniref:uncharacterized protein LOC128549334 n=1 Tax=Mercenaria mercenaria TaxID=6596 RepID=UPI00234ED0EF|nr:uncharacterized protein LOC128549334 [Mercenaria mercenaria]